MKLEIKDLHAVVIDNETGKEKEILKGLNLSINTGEMHAIMGPNGTGKSTLASVIMGSPEYIVTKGSITLDGEDVLAMSVDERSKKGIFLAMQNPNEIPGITNSDFIKSALDARLDKDQHVSLFRFIKDMDKAVSDLKMNPDLPHRYINEGFSGGEKKRNEILQLILLEPKIAMLDEIDSGLDVDAIQVVADVIKKEQEKGRGFLVISHYARLFDLIKPTRAVVIINGRVVVDGGPEVIKRIDTTGYEFIKTELGIEIAKEDANMNTVSIGTCAVRESIKK